MLKATKTDFKAISLLEVKRVEGIYISFKIQF